MKCRMNLKGTMQYVQCFAVLMDANGSKVVIMCFVIRYSFCIRHVRHMCDDKPKLIASTRLYAISHIFISISNNVEKL